MTWRRPELHNCWHRGCLRTSLKLGRGPVMRRRLCCIRFLPTSGTLVYHRHPTEVPILDLGAAVAPPSNCNYLLRIPPLKEGRFPVLSGIWLPRATLKLCRRASSLWDLGCRARVLGFPGVPVITMKANNYDENDYYSPQALNLFLL